MVWCKNHPAPVDGAGPRAWPPSYRAIMSLREARWSCRAWKTNSPQDPSDNIIYIIAWKHLHKKQWLQAASLTCHSYERLGFDVQWVKEIILGHADVVTPRHVWTTKRGPLIWLQRRLLLHRFSLMSSSYVFGFFLFFGFFWPPSLPLCDAGSRLLRDRCAHVLSGGHGWHEWHDSSPAWLHFRRSIISWFNWLK